MGKVVYLKDRRPEAPGQIIAKLEKARQEMTAVEKALDERIHQVELECLNIERENKKALTPRQIFSTIGLVLLIVGFVAWRIVYGA